MFLNALPAAARQLLGALGKLTVLEQFYLAGGSAAALHLGHRVSVDLDFFSGQGFESEKLLPALASLERLTVLQQSADTLLAVLNAVRISFFVYPYPLLESCAPWEGVRLASLLDIGLMKWIAIGQRGRKRDFVDCYFICRGGPTLSELLVQMPRKYPEISYPSYHFLRALTYFDDAERDPDPQMLVPWEWTTTKRFFEAEAVALLRSLSEQP